MNIVLFDNQYKTKLLPLTFLRAISEIRVGILTIREKWELLLSQKVSIHTDLDLQELYPLKIEKDTLFIAGNCIPSQNLVQTILNLPFGTALLNPDDELIAVRTDSINFLDSLTPFKAQTYSELYTSISEKHHIFQYNALEIVSDFHLLTKNKTSAPLSHTNILLGDPTQLFIEEGATVEASTINCKNGPVYIGKDAEIMEGALIRGPFALLDHGVVKMGAKIYEGTTIGPFCKVGGELSNVVMFGYSNKAHDGFLGNSVIGTWCNIGAGTSSSNLKNDYSNVKQWDYATDTYPKTGLQFCGLIMGDHSKCGINVSFNTGTVMGICSNVYGSNFQAFHIQSFMIGSPDQGYTKNSIEKITASEIAMMKRRNIDIDETYLRIIRRLYAKTN